MSFTDFSSFPLPSNLLEGVASLGFAGVTPVQAQSLPSILAGRDVLVQAETGSGKTLAFALGMLVRVEARPEVQALAMCPTRELAEQVAAEIRRLACRTPNVKVLTLCGGVPFAPQRASLKHGAHVLVGTPGRVDEHVRKGSLSLEHVQVLVLDEADRMLDMGFEPQIARVAARAPRDRQTLLFSATYPQSISKLSRAYQREALRIKVASARSNEQAGQGGSEQAPRLMQRFIRVPAAERTQALAAWLAREQPESTLVFCNTRLECAAVASELSSRGWVAAAIHGDMAQRERQHVKRLFANGSCSVLVATDVAARGWDIPDLPAVASLGLSRDPTVHVHRIGRTGRSDRTGLVVNFVSDEDDQALEAIERAQGQLVTWEKRAASSRGFVPPPPRRVTLLLGAGKNKKLRPGDILGALTAEGGIAGDAVGAIEIDDDVAYVAVDAASSEQALRRASEAPVKGRRIKVRLATLELPRAPSSDGAHAVDKQDRVERARRRK
jgi:ATP-independent RNA helicase DbpA